MSWTACKVFSATKHRQRAELGDWVTEWIRDHPEVEIVGREVRQSSDEAFHCLSIVIFYRDW